MPLSYASFDPAADSVLTMPARFVLAAMCHGSKGGRTYYGGVPELMSITGGSKPTIEKAIEELLREKVIFIVTDAPPRRSITYGFALQNIRKGKPNHGQRGKRRPQAVDESVDNDREPRFVREPDAGDESSLFPARGKSLSRKRQVSSDRDPGDTVIIYDEGEETFPDQR